MRDFTEPELNDKVEVIRISSLPEYDISDYDLSNPKELTQYFKNIERICRGSRTYKKLVDFLREHVDMNKCSFYKNINNLDTYSIKIHIHHSPLTLYDIVTTVYSKRVVNHETLSENIVAKEVMWVHYNMIIGLIPLSETVHGLVHNGILFIPTTKVYGMYKKFIDIYGPYIDPDTKRILSRLEEMSETYEFNTKVLEVSPVYIDSSGAYEFPNLNELAQQLSDKVNEIDKNNVSTQYNIEDKEKFVKKEVS